MMESVRYVWGVDLGYVRDPTAVAVISRTFRDRRWWYVLGALWQLKEGDIDARQGVDFYEALSGWLCGMQSPVHPPGARVPYLGHSLLAVDGTGPGRDATFRFLRGRLAKTVRMVPVQIRASSDAVGKQGDDGWFRTSRKDLVVTLDSVSESGRLSFVGGLQHQKELEKQLVNFRIKESADDGFKRDDHDDLAVALALAVTLAERLTQVAPGGLVPVRYV